MPVGFETFLADGLEVFFAPERLGKGLSSILKVSVDGERSAARSGDGVKAKPTGCDKGDHARI